MESLTLELLIKIVALLTGFVGLLRLLGVRRGKGGPIDLSPLTPLVVLGTTLGFMLFPAVFVYAFTRISRATTELRRPAQTMSADSLPRPQDSTHIATWRMLHAALVAIGETTRDELLERTARRAFSENELELALIAVSHIQGEVRHDEILSEFVKELMRRGRSTEATRAASQMTGETRRNDAAEAIVDALDATRWK